jgi:hypothetical protein
LVGGNAQEVVVQYACNMGFAFGVTIFQKFNIHIEKVEKVWYN